MNTLPETPTVRPLPLGSKFSYGLGAVAYALPYQVMASFFLFYTTAILKVAPAVAGFVIAVSVLWDAITDPWIGHVSDRSRSDRFGRRHKFLLLGGIGTAIGSILLWSIPPDMNVSAKIALLLGALLFVKTMNTVYGAPYYALGGAISQDYDERSSLQGWRAAFHVLGMIMALVGTQVFIFRSTPEFPRGQLDPAAYPKIGVAVALITLVVALIAVLTIPKDHRPGGGASRRGLAAQIRAALAGSSFRAIVLVIFLIEVAFQMIVSISTHVNTFTYGLNGPQMGILGLAILGMSVLSQPFWVLLCRRFEKRDVLILGMVFGLIGFVGMPWVHVGLGWLPIGTPGSLWTLALFSAVAGIGNGAFMSIPFSMVSDAADEGQLTSAQRQEGLYFGLYTFAYKLGIAVSVLIGGILLDMIGFVAGADEQSPETAYQLAMAPTWLLVGMTPLILWALLHYRIDRRAHARISSRLAAQEAG